MENIAHSAPEARINPRLIEPIPIGDLKPYPERARRHSKKQIEKLSRSIARFGIVAPILIDETNVIIAGHAVVDAAKLAGRLGSIAAAQGQGLIFTVFAAAVIGGISLDGGKGTLFGALCGVIVLGLIQNILTLAGVTGEWIGAIYGAIILAALMLARVTSGKAQD